MWNYRIVRQPCSEHAPGQSYFALHEVFYNDKNEPIGMTEDAISFQCDDEEGPEGILESLKMALRDCTRHPVLDKATTVWATQEDDDDDDEGE